ncbi:hypothetical protein NDN08_008391 [Rhodosorus marinus]|uniref:Uncharacterized protein n=1 Tax=Rhodosorus marinus TaxID=101924 RepID=A0AAV8V0B4_9RHOD|nr:hypothetical protein NDN08_008391 [Rhodosorus marinus]
MSRGVDSYHDLAQDARRQRNRERFKTNSCFPAEFRLQHEVERSSYPFSSVYKPSNRTTLDSRTGKKPLAVPAKSLRLAIWCWISAYALRHRLSQEF